MQCSAFPFRFWSTLSSSSQCLCFSWHTERISALLILCFSIYWLQCDAVSSLFTAFPTIQCDSIPSPRRFSAFPCIISLRVASPIRCHSVFLVFFHHLLNFRRHNIRRQQLENVGRRRSFVRSPMLDCSSWDAVLADKFRLRHAADGADF